MSYKHANIDATWVAEVGSIDKAKLYNLFSLCWKNSNKRTRFERLGTKADLIKEYPFSNWTSIILEFEGAKSILESIVFVLHKIDQ